METVLAVLGFLTAAIGAWVLWYRHSRKSPLDIANEELERRTKAKKKIRLDVQLRNTDELEKTSERHRREFAALRMRLKKTNPSD